MGLLHSHHILIGHLQEIPDWPGVFRVEAHRLCVCNPGGRIAIWRRCNQEGVEVRPELLISRGGDTGLG